MFTCSVNLHDKISCCLTFAMYFEKARLVVLYFCPIRFQLSLEMIRTQPIRVIRHTAERAVIKV